MTFTQHGGWPIDAKAVVVDENGSKFNKMPQTDITIFANDWLKNIASQPF